MHIKTITEEWVTHRGWGGRTTLSPFRTLLSPQHSHISGAPKVFHCPGSLHQSLPPWYKQWEGYGPQIRNRIQGIFRKQSSAIFKFFFLCASKERKGERHNSLAMNHLGSSATPTICTFRKCFPLKCSPCICSIIGRRMNSGKQRCADEIKFIYSLIPNSLPHSEIP